MAVTLNLRSSRLNLYTQEGQSVRVAWTFWADAAKTMPFDFTGWTAWEATFDNTAGAPFSAGLDVSALPIVVMTMTITDLAALPRSSPWRLAAVDANGDPQILYSGRHAKAAK